jgi:DNA/RNA-binding domain of Phe-tRNA-synthetase-like protein
LRDLGYAHLHPAPPATTWPGSLETGPPRQPAWEVRPALQRWAAWGGAGPEDEGPSGRALDLACGSGRAAVYLALLGWSVTAIDILPEALEMAQALARRWGVGIRAVQADLEESAPVREGIWELVTVFRFLSRTLLAWIREAVRPGGLLLYETFTVRQAPERRPRDRRFLLEPGELRRAFAPWEELEYAEGTDEAGDALALLVARRPRPTPAARGSATPPGGSRARTQAGSGGGGPMSETVPIPLEVAPEVRGRVLLGLLGMDGVDPGRPQDPIHEELERLARELRGTYPEPSAAQQLLRPARDLYRALGLDPTKTRPSSEALFRRLLKGQGLYRINAVVDAANLCSVRMMLSVGLYDAARLEPPLVLRVGREGESYEGIGKGTIHLAGRWVLADAQGPFGNPSADSWRTRITEATRRILMVVFAPGGYDPEAMERHLRDSAETIARYCGGRATTLQVVA